MFTKQKLWEGAIVGGITNALMSARSDLFGNFRQWSGNEYTHDGFDYVLDGMDGREGVIVFEHGWHDPEGCLVGLFFDANSKLSPYSTEEYDINKFLEGIPEFQREIATYAIKDYLSEEDDGQIFPIVTAAFWNDGEALIGNASWQEIFTNGGSLIETELMGYSELSMGIWKKSYETDEAVFDLIVDLYKKRIDQPYGAINLSEDYYFQFAKLIKDKKSFSMCESLLSGLDIVLPSKLIP